MKQSRFWLVSTFLWLFFLYNVERLGEPINIASFVYIYTILCAVLVVLIPSVHKKPFYLSTLVALPVYFLLKFLFNYEILGQNLPITVTEIAFIGITIFLTSKIGRNLDALNKIVKDLTVAPYHKGTHTFESGQAQIYREIRRARHYHRPAALLSISVTDESIDSSLDRFVQEAQKKIAREYISARLADFLTQELQDTDVITIRNEHFITLLPEAGRESVAEVVRRLQLEAKEKLGLNLRIGSSTFPDEAVTFERMLERAEAEMYHQENIREGRIESTSAQKGRVLQI